MLHIILLGMGVQSTALYFMSSMGQLPRADYAIFADTGKEGTKTYQYLEFLRDWKEKNNGIPIVVCKGKNLYRDLIDKGTTGRFTSIPAFTRNEDGSVGMLKRQCTGEYKILVIDNYIRDHIYRLPPGSRRPKTALWHGITLDEIERMSIPMPAWKINTYPFLGQISQKHLDAQNLDWGILKTREEVINWYLLHELPVPPKSSCVFCPYHSDHSWAMKKKNEPEDFKTAVEVDEAIRNSASKGILNPIYLHRSCRPLADVVFDPGQVEEWGECSGICHV